MKRMKKLFGFSAIAMLAWGLTACSNDLSTEPSGDLPSGNDLFSPVKTPKVNAWSGNQDLSKGVMGTRSIQPGLTPPSVPYGSDEFKAVKDFFTKNDELFANEETPQGGIFLTIEEAFGGWENYWVQTLEEQSGDYDAYHTLNNLGIWNEFDNSWTLKRWTEKGNEYFKGGEGDNTGHFKSIYNKNVAPWRLASPVKFENWPIHDFSYTTYLEDKWSQTVTGKYSYIFGKQPTVYRDSEDPLYYYYTMNCTPTPSYRIAKIDGYDEIYVAFYVQDLDYDKFLNLGSVGSEAVPLGVPDFGDGKWDVIIKLTQIKEDSYPEVPETPNENNGEEESEEETEEVENPTNNPLFARLAPFFPVCAVDECGHEVHDGPCPQCEEEGTEIDCSTKGSPNLNDKSSLSEVEVNLSILDEHSKYDITDLVTKLSIHVRYPRDVEVILPVPTNIYCDQDDLYILKDHYFQADGTPNWKYGGENNMVVYDIDGNTVELHVEFVTPDNDNITAGNTGFIRVYTVGINEEVISYLFKNFGDGINFEVFNYYNRGTMYTTGNYPEIDAEELQGYLNHSMVNFDWEELMADRAYPAFYIMAFNELDKDDVTGDGNVNEKDCYVWIFGDDRANTAGFYNSNVTYTYSRDLTTNWFNASETDFRDENERSFFHNAYKGTHYNSSKYNWIFTHKGVTGSDDPANNSMYIPMPERFPFE